MCFFVSVQADEILSGVGTEAEQISLRRLCEGEPVIWGNFARIYISRMRVDPRDSDLKKNFKKVEIMSKKDLTMGKDRYII